uniref:VQ domain-containing protein n=1 Tax=Leersia perrieri TaxID=77586 RepID=A0A0D9V5L2_9ORYZ
MEPSTKQLLPMPHQQDPNSPSSSTSSSSSSSTSPSHPHHRAPPPHPNLPPSPRPVPRTIETTPFPTTFVQADTASFKQVVQMLTGAEQPPKNAATATTAAGNSGGGGGIGGGQGANGGPCRPKKPAFKLYERRSSMKNLKMIAPLAMGALPSPSPRKLGTPEILSPSVLDFPSLKLSPVTPLTGEPFNRSPASSSSEDAERAAISERGFFLHPSPRGAEPPRLLPLFPVSSPRMAASAAATSE